ncbi:hypothetical protein [Streptomyces sp. NPDC057413]|uniref:hypothetical protein n=1 Tax=Streptomyces sp. NPDC057413 TaxID=3346124 RepID=UPI0036A48C10
MRDRELKHALLRAPGGLTARARLQPALDEHAASEVMVHDAPLLQVVYMVLELVAEEEESASADLLRAAADVLDRLVGASHICNPAIYGVRAGEWLTEPRTWERIYTTTAPVAVVAAAALSTMREAARILDEDQLTDATACSPFRRLSVSRGPPPTSPSARPPDPRSLTCCLLRLH